MKRPWTAALVLVPTLLASCAKEPAAGIVLGLQTDIVVPDGIDAVSLVVSDERTGAIVGAPITRSVTAGTNTVRFPATLTLETAFDEPTFSVSKPKKPRIGQIRVSLVGLHGNPASPSAGTAVILRRIVTTMPTDALHFLRIQLDALDRNSVAPVEKSLPTGAAFEANYRSIKSDCPSGDAFDRVLGNCVRIPDLKGESLPLFAATSASTPATCFDTAAAFARGTRVQFASSAECTVALPAGVPADPSAVAVALEGDGILYPADAPDDDAQASSGVPAKYTFAGTSIRFDPGVCALLVARKTVQAAWISGAGAKGAGQSVCAEGPTRVDAGVPVDGGVDGGGSVDPIDALFGPIERIGGNENAIDFDVASDGTMSILGTMQGTLRLVDVKKDAPAMPNAATFSTELRGRYARDGATGYLWTGGGNEPLRLRKVNGQNVAATPSLLFLPPARVLAFAIDPLTLNRASSYIDQTGPHFSINEGPATDEDVRAISFGDVGQKRVTYIGRGDGTGGVGVGAANFSSVSIDGGGIARTITPLLPPNVLLAIEKNNTLVLQVTDENLVNPGAFVVAATTLEPERLVGEAPPGAVFLANVPADKYGLYFVATVEGIRAFTFDRSLQPVSFGWLMKPSNSTDRYVNIGLKVGNVVAGAAKCLYFTSTSDVSPAPTTGAGPGQFRRCLK